MAGVIRRESFGLHAVSCHQPYREGSERCKIRLPRSGRDRARDHTGDVRDHHPSAARPRGFPVTRGATVVTSGARDQAYPSVGIGASSPARYPGEWRVPSPCIDRVTPNTPCSYARVLLDAYARGARQRGIHDGRTGMVTVIQRSASGLNVNPHFHTLVLDGVFSHAGSRALEFHPAPAPSDDDVAEVVATVRHRVQRLLVRRGLEPGDDATGPADRLAEDSPLLAGIMSASVQGRVALGSRAGARARRVGQEPDVEAMTSRGPRQAHLEGFDLHANVWVSANDRAGLERLCRYVLRPPFAQERLRQRGDGRVALELKKAWRDGTRELVFEPLEFLERLAAMTPRPETNLLICHGVLAPRARWRARVIVHGRPVPEPTASTAPLAAGPDATGVKTASPRPWSSAALM